ncbi:3032_t:CDS:10 [Diversispora eburnea]|uniref:3032_t:CDS:1 n=1 Tax=Diversispora eburnea TaxID=1213867 RepID=A0A9N8V367_9GLOM|nr:3032_t:CDS:10 [Diversispora eburnea]
MDQQVSTGILKLMFAAHENEKPILQVMKVDLTNPPNQVAFSDGRDYVQAMITLAIMKTLGKVMSQSSNNSPQSLQRPQAPQVRSPQQPNIRPPTSQTNDGDEGRGEGKLFNVTLLDNSEEIRATAFNQQVDEFFNVLQEGKTKINGAKKQYSSLKNDYEITLESRTQIVPCPDIDPMNMLKLMKHEKDSTIGIVKSADDLQSITTKATQKMAENFEMKENPVVVCKNVKVGDYQGRSLSVFSGTTLLYNPNIHEAKELHENQEFNPFAGMRGEYNAMQERIENRKTIEQVKSENLGSGEKKENNYYPACVNVGCTKKVSDENRDDSWNCEKCGQTFSQQNYRYIALISVADYTDSTWFQFYDAVFEKVYFKPYIFRCRAKIVNYNDNSRVRCTVANISPVDYIAQSKEMFQNIKILDP